MEIETDYETVETDSETVAEAHEPGLLLCCVRKGTRTPPAADSKAVTPAALKAERAARARRRAAFFAARDAAFEKAGLPIPRIEERGGVRVERRGTCVGGAAFNPTIPISPKSYYYR